MPKSFCLGQIEYYPQPYLNNKFLHKLTSTSAIWSIWLNPAAEFKVQLCSGFMLNWWPAQFDSGTMVPWHCPWVWQCSVLLLWVWPPWPIPFCFYALSLYECFVIILRNFCVYPRHRNSWQVCWQLAALPLPVQCAVNFGRTHFRSHESLFTSFFVSHPSYHYS